MKKLLLSFLIISSYTAHTQTVKKVMLEDYSGMWCHTCPNGSKAVDDMDALHGNKFIAVAPHNKDYLETDDSKFLDSTFGVGTYPSATIDRKMYSGEYPVTTGSSGSSWKTRVSSQLAQTAIVSVGLDNLVQVNDSTYEGDIKVKFVSAAAVNTPIAVNLYVLESKIEAKKYTGTPWGTSLDLTQKNSTNYYGHNGSSWVYTSTASSGNTFYFHHTLRTAVGGPLGWTGVVPQNPVVGTEYTKHFTFQVSPTVGMPIPWKPENVEVVAYVSYLGDISSDEMEVLNAERVMLSAFKSTSVKDAPRNTSVINMYPNPAQANDVVNIEYSIPLSGKVTMNLYTVTGQLIAQPYMSDEVKGAHLIMWRPDEYNLTPGVYFVELSAQSGKTTQRIVIQ